MTDFLQKFLLPSNNGCDHRTQQWVCLCGQFIKLSLSYLLSRNRSRQVFCAAGIRRNLMTRAEVTCFLQRIKRRKEACPLLVLLEDFVAKRVWTKLSCELWIVESVTDSLDLSTCDDHVVCILTCTGHIYHPCIFQNGASCIERKQQILFSLVLLDVLGQRANSAMNHWH